MRLENAQLYKTDTFHVLAQDIEITWKDGTEPLWDSEAVDGYKEALSSELSKEATNTAHSDYSIMYETWTNTSQTKIQHAGRSCIQLLSEAVELLAIVLLGEGDPW